MPVGQSFFGETSTPGRPRKAFAAAMDPAEISASN